MPSLRREEGYHLLSLNRYSVRWKGWIYLKQTGVYRFATNSDDGSYLKFDGKTLVRNGGAHGLKKVSAEISVQKGVYPLEVLYFQIGGASIMETLWTPPGKAEQQLPGNILFSQYPGKGAIFGRFFINFLAIFLKILWAILLCLSCFFGGKKFIVHYKLFVKSHQLALVALSLFAFFVAYFSPINYTGSDPYLTLLTSQAILEYSTIQLDRYVESGMNIHGHDGHALKKHDHLYYYFPLGTSLYALPFVGFAKLCGLDMTRPQDDAFLQNLLSALLVTASFLLSYRLCCYFLNSYYSLLFSSVFVFGSSLMSTMGTALWNVNFTMIFILLTVLLIVGYDCGQRQSLNPYLLGFLLFSAYLCRPTAAIFIVAMFSYVLHKDRKVFLKMALTSLGFLCLFVLFSWREYHQLLPDYYLPSRLSQTETFWIALYGNFFSPSRGVLIFSPYLLLTLLAGLFSLKRLTNHDLFWVALFWTLFHTIAISRFPIWWGGGSYGNRLFTDAFPALMLLTLLTWRIVLKTIARNLRCLVIGLLILLGGISIFINLYQGLYNHYTVQWSSYPIWGLETDYMLDWKYPQFLANPDLLAQRSREYQAKMLQPYKIGEIIEPAFSKKAIFDGWYSAAYHPEIGQHYRWSQGRRFRIDFQIDSHEDIFKEQFILQLKLGAFQEQSISIAFNDRFLGTITQRGMEPSWYEFSIEGSFLRNTNEYDPYQHLEFTISNPADPEHGKTWEIGISIWELRLQYNKTNDNTSATVGSER